jgi:hypothetical protein
MANSSAIHAEILRVRSAERHTLALKVHCLARFERGELTVLVDGTATVGELTDELYRIGHLLRSEPSEAWMVVHLRAGAVLRAECTLTESNVRYGDVLYWRIDSQRIATTSLRYHGDREPTARAARAARASLRGSCSAWMVSTRSSVNRSWSSANGSCQRVRASVGIEPAIGHVHDTHERGFRLLREEGGANEKP